MAENTQRLEIVTPERKVFSGDVSMVVVPGVEGEMGFLPNHAPLMSALRIGVIRVQQEGKPFKVAIANGFVEVRNNRVTILADSAEHEEKIDVKRAEEAKARAEQRLASKTPDVDQIRAEAALKRAVNRINTVKH